MRLEFAKQKLVKNGNDCLKPDKDANEQRQKLIKLKEVRHKKRRLNERLRNIMKQFHEQIHGITTFSEIINTIRISK